MDKPPIQDYSNYFAAMLKAQTDFVESGNAKPKLKRRVKPVIIIKKRNDEALK